VWWKGSENIQQNFITYNDVRAAAAAHKDSSQTLLKMKR